jgi:hypothetical protein
LGFTDRHKRISLLSELPRLKHCSWLYYYDPNKNVFCGKYDCYRILNFDYKSFGKNRPDTRKVITKRYRALSREWHPDKSKHHDAKERFMVRAPAPWFAPSMPVTACGSMFVFLSLVYLSL